MWPASDGSEDESAAAQQQQQQQSDGLRETETCL